MKIRIRGNSVRFRLTKTEVDKFSSEGYVEEHTAFNENIFSYALSASTEDEALNATFTGNKITFNVPAAFAKDWAGNDIVGTKNIQILEDGTELFLLLEKDFVCLDETFEDQSDNYPNPKAC